MLRFPCFILCVLGMACAAGKESSESWDSAVESETGGKGDRLAILEVDGSAGGKTVSWVVTAGPSSLGTVRLYIVETGDPEWEDGCTTEVGAGGLVCGVWAEYHDDFGLVDWDDASETKAINLVQVALTRDQESNESTAFNPADESVASRLTVMVQIADTYGEPADCVVAGDYPEFFSGQCTNEIEGW